MSRRREPRYEVDLDVKVWGMDRHGKPFVQQARTVNANPLGGARLAGIDCVNVGEVIDIQHAGEKSRFQVVWVGRDNTAKAGQIGVHCVDPRKTLFAVALKNTNAGAVHYEFPSNRTEWSVDSLPRVQRRPMPDIPSSRRKTTRYHCTGGVELRRQEGAPPIFGNLSDISLEGCYVESSATFPAGSDVVFLIRVGNVNIRGRAHVKTSNHAVGLGLEFVHLAAEDQQKLDFLVGSLAGTQEMRPEEMRRVVAEDPMRKPAPLTTRPIRTAQVNTPRPASSPMTGAMSQKITSALNELDNLEQTLVRDRLDPRLIAQLHDAIGHVRQTAWTVQQYVDLSSTGGDPFEVLPQLEAERMQMLSKLAHNVTADIDSTSINQYTMGISQLYESVQTLYRRLHRLLVDESGG